jgi:hypothetical protein
MPHGKAMTTAIQFLNAKAIWSGWIILGSKKGGHLLTF